VWRSDPSGWAHQIRERYHDGDPRNGDGFDCIETLWVLLRERANSDYGLVLDPPAQPSSCEDGSTPEKHSNAMQAVHWQMCDAESVNGDDELIEWLTGVSDG